MRSNLNRVVLAAEYLADGRSIAWVAREFDLEHRHVSVLVNMLGLSGLRSSPSKASLDTYDQVEQAVLEGWPPGEIYKTYGIPRSTLERWFPERPRLTPKEIGALGILYQKNLEARRKWRESNDWSKSILITSAPETGSPVSLESPPPASGE